MLARRSRVHGGAPSVESGTLPQPQGSVASWDGPVDKVMAVPCYYQPQEGQSWGRGRPHAYAPYPVPAFPGNLQSYSESLTSREEAMEKARGRIRGIRSKR